MLGLALVRRFSLVRSVLPAVSRSGRYNSTNAAQGEQPALPENGEKLVAVDSELFGSSIDTSKLWLDPSQLPLPNTPDVSQGPFSEELYAASYVPGRSIHLPFLHQRTHSIPVAALHFRSHHTELLELYTHFVSHAATALGIPISRVVPLPTQRTLWTVPKSPFVHKKSQENFERKVHKRLIKAWDADQEVVDRWLQYVQKHSIGGVGIRIVRWERVAVGVGKKRLEDVSKEMDARAEIQALGERIVQESSGTS